MKIPTSKILQNSLKIAYGDNRVEVIKPIYYNIHKSWYVIPKGFKSDGVSNPFLKNPLTKKQLAFGLIHDYFYRTRIINKRIYADLLALDILPATADRWTAYKTYWGLRIFGGFAWKNNFKKGLEKYPDAKFLAMKKYCKR